MKRRIFTQSLVVFAMAYTKGYSSPETNSSYRLLGEFIKLFKYKSHSYLFGEKSLKNSIKSALATNWQGYQKFGSRYYEVGSKFLIPIHLTLNGSLIDYSIICFEKTERQVFKTLSKFYIESVLSIKDQLPTQETDKILLPIFSKPNKPYGFCTEKAEIFLKTNFSENQFTTDFILKIKNIKPITKTFAS